MELAKNVPEAGLVSSFQAVQSRLTQHMAKPCPVEGCRDIQPIPRPYRILVCKVIEAAIQYAAPLGSRKNGASVRRFNRPIIIT